MEKYILKDDVRVLGRQVTTFPLGIGETFDSLEQMLPDGKTRDYYGISHLEGDKIVYFAAAKEKFDGEAGKYQCDSAIISSGEYLVVPIYNWTNHLESIKEIFHDMMQDKRIDHTQPCIEWYKTMDEMWCMIKVSPAVMNGRHSKVSDKKV